MRLPDSTSLTNAVWSSYSEWAIWQSPWYEMRLSAPAVLLPEDSPDGLWHLFAHSWMGIEHYSSPSGFDWSKVSLVALRGHYPSLYRERNTWHLVYESHDRDYSGSIRLDRKRTISRIWMMSSSDLRNWSSPQMILSAADVPYASDFSVPRLAHPQIVPWEGGYRLYFTASELKMYDSGQKASACLGTRRLQLRRLPRCPDGLPERLQLRRGGRPQPLLDLAAELARRRGFQLCAPSDELARRRLGQPIDHLLLSLLPAQRGQLVLLLLGQRQGPR